VKYEIRDCDLYGAIAGSWRDPTPQEEAEISTILDDADTDDLRWLNEGRGVRFREVSTPREIEIRQKYKSR